MSKITDIIKAWNSGSLGGGAEETVRTVGTDLTLLPGINDYGGNAGYEVLGGRATCFGLLAYEVGTDLDAVPILPVLPEDMPAVPSFGAVQSYHAPQPVLVYSDHNTPGNGSQPGVAYLWSISNVHGVFVSTISMQIDPESVEEQRRPLIPEGETNLTVVSLEGVSWRVAS